MAPLRRLAAAVYELLDVVVFAVERRTGRAKLDRGEAESHGKRGVLVAAGVVAAAAVLVMALGGNDAPTPKKETAAPVAVHPRPHRRVEAVAVSKPASKPRVHKRHHRSHRRAAVRPHVAAPAHTRATPPPAPAPAPTRAPAPVPARPAPAPHPAPPAPPRDVVTFQSSG
jgi:hypothetical protein